MCKLAKVKFHKQTQSLLTYLTLNVNVIQLYMQQLKKLSFKYNKIMNFLWIS